MPGYVQTIIMTGQLTTENSILLVHNIAECGPMYRQLIPLGDTYYVAKFHHFTPLEVTICHNWQHFDSFILTLKNNLI